MPLFGKKRDPAQDEAERAEIERLTALPPADLAVEIMPAFGPEGPRGGKEMSSLQIVIWLMRRHPRGTRNVDALHTAVREAMQVLEHAELIWKLHSSRSAASGSDRWNATRLGEAALANGDVRQHIKDRTT
jgi:hypothetical protein